MVTSERKKQATIDLVQEFYKIKAEIRAYGMYGGNKSRPLAERKHELMWKINNELSHASKKRKGDKIRKKLWEELGVMI